MTGLDTNVLDRYVMQDDHRQLPLATSLLESLNAEAPGFVPVVVLIERVGVLSGSCGLNRLQVAAVLSTLLRSKELVLDQAEWVAQALKRYTASGAEFAGLLIERLSAAAGCSATMTFDAVAVKAAGMTLVR